MGPIEKEFDPTEYSAELVAVERDETISSILERVGEALGRTPNVVLVVPRGTEAFNTTQDFLALSKLQWTGEVRVSVASPDPTIAGLARVLGFHIVDPPPNHPALAGDPAFDQDGQTDDGIEQPTSPLPLGGMPDWVVSPAIPVITTPSSSLTTSTWLNMPGDVPQTRAAAPPIKRAGMPPPRTKPRQTGVLLPTNIADAPPLTPIIDPAKVNDPKTEDGDAKARRAIIDANAARSGRRLRYNSAGKTIRLGRVLAIVAVLLVVSLVAGSAYAYVYLPEGTISVTPLQRPIQDLPIDVTVQTAPLPSGVQQGAQPANSSVSSGTAFTAQPVNGIKLEAPLSEQATAPATGSRQVPTGRAHGTMHFVNTTSSPQTVPAGTQFKAPNGVEVEVTKGGTVPATVFGASFGEADMAIDALVDGPDGNIGSGQLQGVYGGVLNYSNSAMSGGSLQTIKVVTQADIDTLANSLTTKINGEVAGAIALKQQPGETLIPQTATLSGAPQVVSDHKDGEDGDSVKVTVSGVAIGYAYSTDEMDGSISQAMVNWINTPSNIPAYAGPSLTNSVQHDTPVLISFDNATGQAVYSTKASATVKFALTPDMADRIRDQVAGNDITKAKDLIRQTYGGYLDVGSIQAKVVWFDSTRLPGDPSHIVVQLGSGTTGARSTSQPTPQTARPSQR